MKDLVLAKFYWNCGRMGDVEGIFFTTKEDIQKAIGKTVYFGEILGKHSEVYGTLHEKDIEILIDDHALVNILKEKLVNNTVSGYNPFEYMGEDG